MLALSLSLRGGEDERDERLREQHAERREGGHARDRPRLPAEERHRPRRHAGLRERGDVVRHVVHQHGAHDDRAGAAGAEAHHEKRPEVQEVLRQEEADVALGPAPGADPVEHLALVGGAVQDDPAERLGPPHERHGPDDARRPPPTTAWPAPRPRARPCAAGGRGRRRPAARSGSAGPTGWPMREADAGTRRASPGSGRSGRSSWGISSQLLLDGRLDRGALAASRGRKGPGAGARATGTRRRRRAPPPRPRSRAPSRWRRRRRCGSARSSRGRT